MTLAPGSRESDVIVIGAGIVGLAVARELLRRHPELELDVLERESRIGAHQTGHSSGVIHAGIYYEPGSLKAELCVEGARLLYEYCEQRGIESARTGKLILATRSEEIGRLDQLERRGRANGVRGLRRLEATEIAEIEPYARGIAALHSPGTGMVDFGAVAEAYAEDIRAAGGRILTGCGARALIPSGDRIVVTHGQGETRSGLAIGCAGAWSDRLALAAGAPAEPRIVPFRGGYLKLRPEKAHLVRASIYPVPDPELPFLGPHLTRNLEGDVLLGPSALIAGAREAYRLTKLNGRDLASTLGWPGAWRLAWSQRRAAAIELRRALSKRAFAADAARLVPGLQAGDFLPGPSGIRAQAVGRDGSLVDDFVVHETQRALHVRNAPSPAATSSLALARLIADRADRLM
ncbi:MAG: L-2-hydroxyglutarate oxidase [Solirubrobacterales bacterium]